MILSGQSARRAGTDFVKCPTFHCVAQTDHRFVRVSRRLANTLSLVSYSKLNTSLLEIREFRDQLESQVQRALVGAVTESKWWGSLKHRIRDFAIKYGRQLTLVRTKVEKSLEDKFSLAGDGGSRSQRIS